MTPDSSAGHSLTSCPFAADVLLSHALVNGNAPLVDSLLSVGVPLTLEHFKVALKVSIALFVHH